MPRTTIRVGIAPSKNNPDLARSQVQADGRATRRNTPTVLFTTEMGERGQDRRDFTAGLGHSYNVAKATADSENPILFRGDRMGQTWSAHHNVKTPGYPDHPPSGHPGAYWYYKVSPTRTIEVADLAPLRAGTRRVVEDLECRFIGGHHTAYAHSDKYDDGTPQKRWVTANWKSNDELLRDLVADAVRAGFTVFLGSDFNADASKIRPFGKGQITVIDGGIDAVFAIPGKRVTVKPVGRTTVVNVPGSDHHFRWRPVELRSVTR